MSRTERQITDERRTVDKDLLTVQPVAYWIADPPQDNGRFTSTDTYDVISVVQANGCIAYSVKCHLITIELNKCIHIYMFPY